MSAGRFVVFLMHSTSHALRGEKLLGDACIGSKLIPVPRHLSSDCGVCLRVSRADRAAAERVLSEVGVDIEGIHEI
jgi:hypothetical protein